MGIKSATKLQYAQNCGCDPQKVLAEIREKQRLLKKKRRKRTLIVIASACAVVAISVLAYLYYIDALNSIPAQYRNQSKDLLDKYESAIGKNDLNNGIRYFDTLKNRTLTKRQSKRFEETKETMVEQRLKHFEDQLGAIQSDYNIQVEQALKQAKSEMAILNTYQLDTSQTERLYLAIDRYVELQLGYMEKTVGSYKADMQILAYFERINRIAQELQGIILSKIKQSGNFLEEGLHIRKCRTFAASNVERFDLIATTRKNAKPMLFPSLSVNNFPQITY